VTELRALGAERCGTVSGYFDAGHEEQFVSACCDWSGRATGVYVTLNPVNPDLLARAANRAKVWAKHSTSDADIIHRCWLPIDFDPVRPAGISASAAEHDEALTRTWSADQWLRSVGLSEDSIVVGDSGNGGHLLVRVDLENSPAATTLIQQCIVAVKSRFNDDHVAVDESVFNPSRIWKVYGTVAAKGDSTDDRPHTMAQLLAIPEPIVPVPHDTIKRLSEMAPTKPDHPQTPTKRGPQTMSSFDIERWLEKHELPVVDVKPWQDGRIFVLNPCPWNAEHTNRAAFVIQHGSGAIAAGCHHDGCLGNDWHSLRDLVEPGWRDRSRVIPPAGAPPAIQRAYRKFK